MCTTEMPVTVYATKKYRKANIKFGSLGVVFYFLFKSIILCLF